MRDNQDQQAVDRFVAHGFQVLGLDQGATLQDLVPTLPALPTAAEEAPAYGFLVEDCTC